MATRVRMYPPGVARVEATGVEQARDLAEGIARDARVYVPVLTGALLGTIRTTPTPRGARVWAGDVAAGIDYHLYQEYGTSRMAAQPYLRPAAYQHRGGH